MFSDNDKEAKPDKRSYDVLHVQKELRNLINTIGEFQGRVQEEVITVEAFSDIELTSENDQGTSFSSPETKENEVSANSMNTEDEYDRLKALVCSEDSNTALKNYLSGSNSIPSKALAFSGNGSEYYHSNLMLSDTDEESNPVKRSTDVLKVMKEKRNLIKICAEVQEFFRKQDIIDKASPEMKLTLSNERVTSANSHESMKIEMFINFMNADNPFDHVSTFIRSQDPKAALKNYFSGSNQIPSPASKFSDTYSKTYQSELKFSNSDQQSLTLKQSKLRKDEEVLQLLQKLEEIRKRNAEFSFSFPALDNGQVISIGCVETRDNDPDTLVDVFKTVIKCHPIKKFEIPPYESPNAERTLGKFEDTFTKYGCNATQLYGIDEYRNILEFFPDADSHSVLVFDVTDCFIQNSSVICDGLIKEYLNNSAKVNLLLIKQMKDISTEEYELRMRSLRSMDDELGYISSKLIITIHDWIKLYHEIKRNITQSRIGSRGLYQMGILRICVKLVSILLEFSFEKQIALEDYENCLIFPS